MQAIGKTGPTTSNATPRWSPKGARRFALYFVLVAGTLLTAYYFPYDPRGLVAALFRVYLALYTHLAGAAVSLFDPSVHVHGTHIDGKMSFELALSCDAMDVYILFAAATVAFPATRLARAFAIGASFAALLGINVVRIVSLYLIGVYAPQRFEFFHMQLWPLAIVLVAATGFLAWARTARPVCERPLDASVQG